MKMKQKKIATILCLCISILGIQTVSYAETLDTLVEDAQVLSISPMFVNIVAATSSISKSGNTITGKAVTTSRNKGNISITMKLQKQVGGKWENVTSWSTSVSNSLTCSLTKSYTTSANGVYRISSSFTANGENTTVNSSSITKWVEEEKQNRIQWCHSECILMK